MTTSKDTKLYEIGYLVMPLLAAEAVTAEAEELKAGLVSLGATITEEGAPKVAPLGFKMSRRIGEKKYDFQDGFFGYFRFELEPTKALAAKEWWDKRTNLLRYLLIAVDEAAIIADEKAAAAKKAAREANAEKEAAEGVTTEGEKVSEEAVA